MERVCVDKCDDEDGGADADDEGDGMLQRREKNVVPQFSFARKPGDPPNIERVYPLYWFWLVFTHRGETFGRNVMAFLARFIIKSWFNYGKKIGFILMRKISAFFLKKLAI